MINIQVEVREKVELLDEKSWRVVVACGDASLPLRWLAFASILRMAHLTGDVPSKYVPQVVKKMDGTVLNANKSIKDLLEDGSEVVIECSRGPQSFMLNLEERSFDSVHDELKLESSISGNMDHRVADMDRTSDGACNLLELVDWTVFGIEHINHAKDVLVPHVGLLQALIIWYSCQGEELEDKDFGVLNLAQFIQLFEEAMENKFSDYLEKVFKELLKVKATKGSYQMTPLEFLPSIYFVASGSSTRKELQMEERKDLYTKVSNLIDEKLIRTWNNRIKPNFDRIRTISRKECLVCLKDSREILEMCLKACQPGSTHKGPSKLPFGLLLPFLKKWHVLNKSWNYSLVALLVINALQSCKEEASELVEVPLDLRFGVHELQEFLLGAAYFCHKQAVSPIQISEKAYLQEYLNSLFAKACVAKPLYTTYDEKKDYLRSLLINKNAMDVVAMSNK